MNEITKVVVGKRIKTLRLEKKLTREDFAFIADISDKFLYEIESGKKGFSATTLVKISKALKVSMDYIMTGENWKDN